jgi:hypothetical protein
MEGGGARPRAYELQRPGLQDGLQKGNGSVLSNGPSPSKRGLGAKVLAIGAKAKKALVFATPGRPVLELDVEGRNIEPRRDAHNPTERVEAGKEQHKEAGKEQHKELPRGADDELVHHFACASHEMSARGDSQRLTSPLRGDGIHHSLLEGGPPGGQYQRTQQPVHRTGNHQRQPPRRQACEWHVHHLFARSFRALRTAWGFSDEEYARSLATCTPWAAKGGKSGAEFMQSADSRLVLKQIKGPEVQMLLKIAPALIEYLAKCNGGWEEEDGPEDMTAANGTSATAATGNPSVGSGSGKRRRKKASVPSLLCRPFGLYRIRQHHRGHVKGSGTRPVVEHEEGEHEEGSSSGRINSGSRAATQLASASHGPTEAPSTPTSGAPTSSAFSQGHARAASSGSGWMNKAGTGEDWNTARTRSVDAVGKERQGRENSWGNGGRAGARASTQARVSPTAAAADVRTRGASGGRGENSGGSGYSGSAPHAVCELEDDTTDDVYVLVQENLFQGRQLALKFDLKGKAPFDTDSTAADATGGAAAAAAAAAVASVGRGGRGSDPSGRGSPVLNDEEGIRLGRRLAAPHHDTRDTTDLSQNTRQQVQARRWRRASTGREAPEHKRSSSGDGDGQASSQQGQEGQQGQERSMGIPIRAQLCESVLRQALQRDTLWLQQQQVSDLESLHCSALTASSHPLFSLLPF